MKRVAVIGECLVELSGEPFGALRQTFGGDTLNTAVYLARLSGTAATVHYVTVLGEDRSSSGMLERWRREAIDTGLVLRDPSRLPGIYWIQLDEKGERSFAYWRNDSAARYLVRHPDFESVAERLADFDLIYLSGISLAILPEPDREELLRLLVRLAASGTAIAFDSNYRPALWASLETARAAYAAVTPLATLLLLTHEDELRLWGDDTATDTLNRLRPLNARVMVKLGSAGCLLRRDDTALAIPADHVAHVIDTTVAGDAFNAGVLATVIAGGGLEDACRVGNSLAGIVIQHHGAIIPEGVTPSLAALLAGARAGLKNRV